MSGSKNKCLCLGGGNVSITGYTNFDYVDCSNNRKSTSGYIFQFLGGAISWRSRLQECIALSTIEPKYVAASEACKEDVWLARLACAMDIPQCVPILFYDSEGAIELAKKPVYHAKPKHIRLRYPVQPLATSVLRKLSFKKMSQMH